MSGRRYACGQVARCRPRLPASVNASTVPLRIDAPELVALVRVPARRRRPSRDPRTRARRRLRSPRRGRGRDAGRTAARSRAGRCARATRRTRDRRPRRRRSRRAATASTRTQLPAAPSTTRRQRVERRAERDRAPEHVAQQRRVRAVAAGVRGHARQPQQLLGIVGVDREQRPRRCRVECAMREVMSEIQVMIMRPPSSVLPTWPCTSVGFGVVGIVGEHRDPATLAAQDLAPELIRMRREGIAGLGCATTNQASCSSSTSSWPATSPRSRRRRAARRGAQPRSAGSRPTSTVPTSPSTGTHPSVASVATACQRDHRLGRDRTAAEHDAGRGGVLVPLRQHRRERGVARAVEDDAERAVFAVLEQQHDAAVEVRVDQRRGRDEQPAAQRSRNGRPRSRSSRLTGRRTLPGDGCTDSRCSRRCGRWPATRTCSPIPTSSPVRSATGPAASSARRPRSCGPATVDEVAGVLRACRDAGVAVVPQGGNTGLVGGSVPLHGEIVLDLRRLDALGPVDARAGPDDRAGGRDDRAAARARAGRGLGLRRRPRARATPRPSAARSRPTPAACTCCATARPAVRCSASRPCSPTVASCAGSTGWRRTTPATTSPGLLCGSEGTLAVITAARLRLVPAPGARRRGAARVRRRRRRARRGRRAAPRRSTALQAVELFFQDGLDLVCDRLGLARPFAGAARRVRAGGGGRGHRSDRRARRGDRCDCRRRRRRGRGRRSRRPRPLALPRGAHRGDQSARPSAQARRHAARRSARPASSRRSATRSARSRPTPRCGCSATRPTATFT